MRTHIRPSQHIQARDIIPLIIDDPIPLAINRIQRDQNRHNQKGQRKEDLETHGQVPQEEIRIHPSLVNHLRVLLDLEHADEPFERVVRRRLDALLDGHQERARLEDALGPQVVAYHEEDGELHGEEDDTGSERDGKRLDGGALAALGCAGGACERTVDEAREVGHGIVSGLITV
jgi:hypothetical protein